MRELCLKEGKGADLSPKLIMNLFSADRSHSTLD